MKIEKLWFNWWKKLPKINIPFTVGGGISEISDVDHLLKAGADKISINSSAVKIPILN